MARPVDFNLKFLVDFDTDLSDYFKTNSILQIGRYLIEGILSTNLVRSTKVDGKSVHWYDNDNRSHILYVGDKFKQVIIRCRTGELVNPILQVLTRMTNDGTIIAKEGEFLGTSCEDGKMPELYLFPDTWVAPKLNVENKRARDK